MMGRGAIRILLIAFLYAVLYMSYTAYSLQGTLAGIADYWDSFLFVLILSGLGGFSLQMLSGSLRKSRDRGAGYSTPFVLSGSVTILGVLLITAFGAGIYKITFLRDVPLGELEEMYPGAVLQATVLALFTGIVYAVVDHNLNSFRSLQELRLSTMKLHTQQVNLRFESLRSQISPHFLFNSLNTISSLIYRDISVAESFIRNLAGVYKNVLKNYEYPLVHLAEELKLVESYSYLMQVRFEDAFHLEIDLPSGTADFFVPPLSVQMLIENAIKHNRMSQDDPLRIGITARDGYLVVRNNFIGEPAHVKIGRDLYKKPDTPGTAGIGLQNIRERYRMLSSKPVLVSKDDSFTVSLPLITSGETEMAYT